MLGLEYRVGIEYILRAQGGSRITTLGPQSILIQLHGPFGFGVEGLRLSFRV